MALCNIKPTSKSRRIDESGATRGYRPANATIERSPTRRKGARRPSIVLLLPDAGTGDFRCGRRAVRFDGIEYRLLQRDLCADGRAADGSRRGEGGVFMSAPQVFELRARGDRARYDRMREIARTMDATPFFNLMRPAVEFRPFLTEMKRRYRLALATNRSATIPALIDYLGLEGIFDAVASARERCGRSPPRTSSSCVLSAPAWRRRARCTSATATPIGLGGGRGSAFSGARRAGRSRTSHRPFGASAGASRTPLSARANGCALASACGSNAPGASARANGCGGGRSAGANDAALEQTGGSPTSSGDRLSIR